jgi:hypothetical protein
LQSCTESGSPSKEYNQTIAREINSQNENLFMKLNSKLTALLTAAGAMLLAQAPLNATTYFSDNFASGLGQWSGPNAEIIPDSTYGQALTFTATDSGGDLSSTVSVPAGSYLSFDYRGVGGFVGTGSTVDWLAGQAGYPGLAETLTYDNTWRQYEVQVRTTGPISIEIWNGTVGAGPESAFFANVVDSSQPLGVPDGGLTIAMLGAAMGGLTFIRRKL